METVSVLARLLNRTIASLNFNSVSQKDEFDLMAIQLAYQVSACRTNYP